MATRTQKDLFKAGGGGWAGQKLKLCNHDAKAKYQIVTAGEVLERCQVTYMYTAVSDVGAARTVAETCGCKIPLCVIFAHGTCHGRGA